MITPRFKPLANGEFSCYLDAYAQGKRMFKFLGIRFKKDYSPLFAKHKAKVDNVKIHPDDTEKFKIVKEMYLQMELEFIKGTFSFNSIRSEKDLMEEIEKMVVEKNHPTYDAMYYKYLQEFHKQETFENKENKIAAFKSYLQSKKLTEKSVFIYFQRLMIILNEMESKGKIVENKGKKVKAKDGKSKEGERLSMEEIQQLWESSQTNTHWAFLFSCFTGLRFSDIENLQWTQIKNDKIHYTAKKTKKTDSIPLSESAKQILDKITQVEEKPLVFQLKTNNVVNLEIKAWIKANGIEKRITFHSARHTFISMVIESTGGDIFSASKLAGHSNIATTQIYSHIGENQKRSAIDKLPKLQ